MSLKCPIFAEGGHKMVASAFCFQPIEMAWLVFKVIAAISSALTNPNRLLHCLEAEILKHGKEGESQDIRRQYNSASRG